MDGPEEVLRPAEQQQHAAGTYTVQVYCGNCASRSVAEIPTGTPVSGGTCPVCLVAGELQRDQFGTREPAG